jgi:hypothetical protein
VLVSFMNMQTGATEQATHALGQNGRALGDGWQAAKSAIAGSEGGIGPDRLGVAFRGVYDADRAAAHASADPVPDLLVTDADAGTKSVQLYRGADQESEADYGRISSPRL